MLGSGRSVFCLLCHANMSNIFSAGNQKAIEDLIKKVGSIEECYLLDFISIENDVVEPTVSGLGYLLHAAKAGKKDKTHAQSFAAGYECAQEEMSNLTLQIDAIDL